MTRAITALVVLALALPALAHAQAPQTNAPPGNSAVDEYLETVPGASGNHARRRARPAATAREQRRQRALRRPSARGWSGSGRTARRSPTPSMPRLRSRPRKQTAAAQARHPRGTGGSPARELLDAVGGDDGGGGMGLVLPGILIAALLAAITLVLLRRRASS